MKFRKPKGKPPGGQGFDINNFAPRSRGAAAAEYYNAAFFFADEITLCEESEETFIEFAPASATKGDKGIRAQGGAELATLKIYAQQCCESSAKYTVLVEHRAYPSRRSTSS